MWLAASLLNGAVGMFRNGIPLINEIGAFIPIFGIPAAVAWYLGLPAALMAARFKAVRTDRELECPAIDAGLRAAGCELVLLPEGIGEDALCAAVRDADILLMCYTPVTARVIERRRKLKGIVKYGVGIDAIDIAAAMARGIPVVNVPEYAEETVAEGAFALMIALAKKLMPIGREMAATGWAWPTAPWMGLDLAGRTLGIVGHGQDRPQHGAHGGGLPHAGDRLRSACAGRCDAGRGHREGRRPGCAAACERRRLDPRRAQRARRAT